MANISYRVTKRVDIIVGGSKEYDEKSKHHSHTSSSLYTEGYLGANITSDHECPEGHKDYDYEILSDVSESDESCIVVGGSPSILEYGLGEKIDSFDRVIRVNSCPVKGIESHVGSKTNIWVTSLTMQKCLDEKRWGKLFFPNQLLDSEVWFRTEHTMFNYKQLLDINFDRKINCRILKYKKPRKWKIQEIQKNDIFSRNTNADIPNKFHLTTGVYAIIAALQLYKKVQCVGFTFYKENDAIKNHTYSGIVLNENLQKDASKQKECLKGYVDKGRLVFLEDSERQLFDSID